MSLASTAALSQDGATVGGEKIAAVQQGFANPPDDARVLMRWWWFGPAVTKPELQREILAMKSGGIGGFEIQPVYALALDDPQKGIRNLPYLSKDFLDAVSFASKTAHENGMRVDMTLASGWPYGGKHVPVDEASARLRVVANDVASGAVSLPVPAMKDGESLIAVFAGPGSAKQYDAGTLKQVSSKAKDGHVELVAEAGPRVVVFYIASRTGQQVKRAAVDASGFVLDHFSRAAVDDHLHTVGEPLMQAFGDTPPYSVFSDSLEVYGADWTGDLLPEFQRRRGYDLTPHLPELVSGTDEVSSELRHDWGLTLTELIDERYLTPVNDWAIAHHTRFRSQTYGDPAVSLSSNNLVALPEGEGPQWNRFSYTRWATSASHLYGRPITSTETWTWLHSPVFRATPLDMKAEADCFFLEGSNQLIGHGWPYSPPGVAEPGWAFYAAAVFNDHNPWWIVMPDVTGYLQRVSYLLRQGKPANDVAVLLPNDDAYSEFKLGKVSLSDNMPKYVTPELMQQILGAGYNVDYIDAEAIKSVGIPYPVLVLPHVERLSPETLKAIAAYSRRGGKVIAVGSVPSRAPGFANAAAITDEVKQLSQTLFAKNPNARVVSSESDLGPALHEALTPDLQLSSGAGVVGFLHRKLSDADVYFLANTSNQEIHTAANFRTSRKAISSWDPFSGAVYAIDAKTIELNLAPYESRVIVFSDGAADHAQRAHQEATTLLADWTHDWKVSYQARDQSASPERTLHVPSSWTEDPALRFFSGVAVYTKTVALSAADLAGAKSLVLDFGKGTATAPTPDIRSNGTSALLDSPIREAAVIVINGQRIGSVWRPPYRLDVTGALKAGENRIEIRVANTGTNALAGLPPADYGALNAQYGVRFTPQNMDHLEPLPSGILGGVQLLEAK
ncbi:MAG TPA: glycosyl hydrolase [Granulicella sp.]